MRSGSLVVPARLASPSSQRHTSVLSCLLLTSSSFGLLRAHTRAFVRPLVFGPAMWGACETLRITCHRESVGFLHGGHPYAVSDGPTKRPQYMRISRLITATYLLWCDVSKLLLHFPKRANALCRCERPPEFRLSTLRYFMEFWPPNA